MQACDGGNSRGSADESYPGMNDDGTHAMPRLAWRACTKAKRTPIPPAAAQARSRHVPLAYCTLRRHSNRNQCPQHFQLQVVAKQPVQPGAGRCSPRRPRSAPRLKVPMAQPPPLCTSLMWRPRKAAVSSTNMETALASRPSRSFSLRVAALWEVPGHHRRQSRKPP
jgi:hypothetical protein